MVGFVAAGHARGDDEFGMGEVYAINVDPPAWGRGAGRALLAAATASLDARFAVSILWVVDGNQRARALSTSARAGRSTARRRRRATAARTSTTAATAARAARIAARARSD